MDFSFNSLFSIAINRILDLHNYEDILLNSDINHNMVPFLIEYIKKKSKYTNRLLYLASLIDDIDLTQSNIDSNVINEFFGMYPHIRSLRISSNNDISTLSINHLIKCYNNITKLVICDDKIINSSNISFIHIICKNIENIEIHNGINLTFEDIFNLLRINYLKKLKVNCYCDNYTGGFIDLNYISNIEELDLTRSTLCSFFIKSLANVCVKLRKLILDEIGGSINENDADYLLKKAKLLEYLSINDVYDKTGKIFNKLANIDNISLKTVSIENVLTTAYYEYVPNLIKKYHIIDKRNITILRDSIYKPEIKIEINMYDTLYQLIEKIKNILNKSNNINIRTIEYKANGTIRPQTICRKYNETMYNILLLDEHLYLDENNYNINDLSSDNSDNIYIILRQYSKDENKVKEIGNIIINKNSGFSEIKQYLVNAKIVNDDLKDIIFINDISYLSTYIYDNEYVLNFHPELDTPLENGDIIYIENIDYKYCGELYTYKYLVNREFQLKLGKPNITMNPIAKVSYYYISGIYRYDKIKIIRNKILNQTNIDIENYIILETFNHKKYYYWEIKDEVYSKIFKTSHLVLLLGR